MAFIFVIAAMFYLLRKFNWNSSRKIIAIAMIVFSVTVGAFIQVRTYLTDTREGGDIAIERQKYGPVVHWLSENVQGESVVLGNDESSHMVAIYTPHNLFFHRAAMYSLAASKERLMDVWFTFYRLDGVIKAGARETMQADRRNVSAFIYGMHYRELLGKYELIPDDEFNKIVGEFEKTLSVNTATWLKNILSKYEVEYIVWDKEMNPKWALQNYAFLKEEKDFGNMAIYQVIR
jgi:hypothetical protein